MTGPRSGPLPARPTGPHRVRRAGLRIGPRRLRPTGSTTGQTTDRRLGRCAVRRMAPGRIGMAGLRLGRKIGQNRAQTAAALSRVGMGSQSQILRIGPHRRIDPSHVSR